MNGSGILKGLAVTAKNFVGSFHDPERFVTVSYPEEKSDLPENARQFPFLVYDGDAMIDGLRCVACRICEKECPPQCIYIVIERDANGKPVKRPKVFDIDISVCMSCQICVEVCPFDAIKMDQHFEIAETDRFDALLLRREQGHTGEPVQRTQQRPAEGEEDRHPDQEQRDPPAVGGALRGPGNRAFLAHTDLRRMR